MNIEIDKQLLHKKIKPTAMRQLVLRVFLKQKAAISLAHLEMELENAEKSTLFRTLKTFTEKKLIHSIDDGSGSVKYALCAHSCEEIHEDLHVHFVCKKCKQTFCLNDVKLPSISLPSDFVLEEVNLIAKGICSSCKK